MQQPNAVQVSMFTVLTIGLTIGLSIAYIIPRRQEIMGNWAKYKTDPFIMFGAPFFKPDDDPRSTTEFAEDNFMDVMGSISHRIFLVFLQPVFELFKLFTETILAVLSNIFSFREILKQMFTSLLRIFEPFMARFRVITHQLRMTFLHLKDAIGRVAAVSTAAIFAGISAIRTMMNMFQLMQIVVAAIIITLVVLTIFFWFVLWPVVPLIVAAIAMIIAAGGGAALGDSAGAFCFAPDTLVECADGTTVPIQSIRVGAVLKGGGVVEATLVFQTPAHPFYSYKGVIVSGSHIVYEASTPRFVQDSAAAIAAAAPSTYYCLSTSTRRIPIRSPSGESLEFADWEELDEDAATLIAWHTRVDTCLNRCPITLDYPTQMLESEAVLSPSTLIQTPTGLTAISALRAGGQVFNAQGTPVRILGVVKMTSSNVAAFHTMGQAALSCSCWVQPPGYMLWKPMHSFARMFPLSAASIAEECWYSLFTEDGTFLLAGGWAVRDFTDVGPDHIADTHSETLRILKERSKVE